MDTRSTRRRNKNARSLALAVIAASMLPLNGCIGPLAQVLGPLTQVLGAVSGVMNLGKTLSSFTSSSPSSSSLPSATSFLNQSGNQADNQTSDAAQGVLGSTTANYQVAGVPNSDT